VFGSDRSGLVTIEVVPETAAPSGAALPGANYRPSRTMTLPSSTGNAVSVNRLSSAAQSTGVESPTSVNVTASPVTVPLSTKPTANPVPI